METKDELYMHAIPMFNPTASMTCTDDNDAFKTNKST